MCHMHCNDWSLLYSMALRIDVNDQACHATDHSALCSVLSVHLHSFGCHASLHRCSDICLNQELRMK